MVDLKNPFEGMSLDPAAMMAMQDTMQKISILMSLLPPIEIKDNYERRFPNPKDPAKPIVKKYVAIFFEKPEAKP